uniref:Uncharacterized protein n=1 Tax=uncultured bacterium BAC AB649/1850 TaxID=1037453 RepID=F6K115_9BACT|nr:hypothetical protein [uncultured bacterium BAC AB649/1850]
MSTHKTDVVGEYLREVELRLSGLPLLQRRELLADLETHIAETRAERGDPGEAELIEILERLGSPEVVAAAAYEEAGPAAFRPAAPAPAAAPATPARSGVPGWLVAVIVAAVVLSLIGCAGLLFFSQSASSSDPAPAVTANR